MTPNIVKVLIADNSPVYKKMFAQAVAGAAENATSAHASDKDELLNKIAREKYDIIVLDAELTRSGTASLIPVILRELPDAAILFAARPSPRNKALFAEAAAKGAAMRLVKPIYGSYSENLAELKCALKGIINISLKSREEKRTNNPNASKMISRFRPELVLIASSTGGPQALETVLTALSGTFPVPILVVQHMLPNFTESFANGLDKKAKLRIKVADSGERVVPGTVYIAPDGCHMALNAQRKIAFIDAPPVSGIRPTADVLFESVADNLPPGDILAVVLTGMGRDGERGLMQLKARHNCYCLVQSEQTCVVYGMPRAAVEAGFADSVLDLGEIAGALEKLCIYANRKRVNNE